MLRFSVLMKKQSGFTLIELLVVIAIIGILSTVILAGLNNARFKSNDAKIKSQLTSMRSALQLYYADNGDYGIAVSGSESAGSGSTTRIGTGCGSGVFVYNSSGNDISRFSLASNYPANASAAGKCTSTGNDYTVSVKLNSANTYWCIDSSGTSKQTGALPSNNATVCP